MPVNEFLVLWLSSWAAIAFFRIAPAFALRGRTLSPRITEALGYIPPAAFAALVANDLVSPGAFDAGLWPALVPWIAAAGVVVVAIRTKSMLWCWYRACEREYRPWRVELGIDQAVLQSAFPWWLLAVLPALCRLP